MLILGTSTSSLQALLNAAVATNELPITVHWVDILSSDQSVYQLGETDLTTAGTGAVTLVSGPGSGHTRTVKYISIYNADTTGATVTVRYNNNGTTRTIVKPLLASGDTLEFTCD